MRHRVTRLGIGMLMLSSAGLGAAETAPTPAAEHLAIAEKFIDAFYSFDPTPLKAMLSSATEGSRGEIVFYQGWAQGGHYRVVRRPPCREESAREVTCSITVEDDLMKALRVPLKVTDTFHLTFADDQIASITTSSDDPPLWEEGKAWLLRNRPGLMDGPCRGYFAGGPTPGDCVRAVVKGLEAFAASPEFPNAR